MIKRKTLSYQKRLPVPSVIELHPVTSRTVAEIGYDDAAQICAVRFVSGDLYHVYPVTRREYQAFVAAPSKGRHYNQVFKDSDCFTIAKIVQQARGVAARRPLPNALDGLLAEFASSAAILAEQRDHHARLRNRLINQLQNQ